MSFAGKGTITKGVGGLYEVVTEADNKVLCMMRGNIRYKYKTPSVGDNVLFEESGDPDVPYVITDILLRRNYLIRPPLANVDYLILTFSVSEPEPDLKLLDKMLIICEIINVKPFIVFTKADLDYNYALLLKGIYQDAGFNCFLSSSDNKPTKEEMFGTINNKLVAFAGPSGVGKSTLCNSFNNSKLMDVGNISDRLKRGKHTTRHVELFDLGYNGIYITDTPGFTSLNLLELGIDYNEVILGYPELVKLGKFCKFSDCRHICEKGCKVIPGIGSIINEGRYERYKEFYQETYDNRNNYSIKVKWRV